MPLPDRSQSLAVVVAFVATVALVVVATVGASRSLWGLGTFAFFRHLPPLIPSLTLLILAPVAYVLAGSLHRAVSQGPSDDRTTLVAGAVGVLLCAACFVLFRSHLHFLGDGYTVLSNFALERPILKGRAFGEVMLHLVVRDLLGGPTREASLLSFRVLSIGAGILTLSLGWFAALRLFDRTSARVLFALGWSTSGFMLLSFGYVELYSVFVLAVAAFALIGLLIARGLLPRLWILLPLVAAIILHVFGLLLIPAAASLWLRNTRIIGALRPLPTPARRAAGLSLLLLGAAALWYLSANFIFFRLAFLPAIANQFTVDGYTLFSVRHLSDLANLMFMLFPAVLLCLPLLPAGIRRERLTSAPAVFLLTLFASQWLAVLIFDPKLGMPRDWDLFSFAGVSLALVCLYPLARRVPASRAATLALVLAIIVNATLLTGRVGVLARPAPAIAQFETYMTWDRHRFQSAWPTLVQYHLDQGDSVSAEAAARAARAMFPMYEQNRVGTRLLQEKRLTEALDIFRAVLIDNPVFPAVYSNLGMTFLGLGHLDSAAVYIEIASGMNPLNPVVHSNYGDLYWARQEYAPAVEHWQRALAMDSTQTQAAVGLMNYAKQQNDRDGYFHYLALVVADGRAPAEPLAALAEYHLGRGELGIGRSYFEQARAKGLDSAAVHRFRTRYPALIPPGQ